MINMQTTMMRVGGLQCGGCVNKLSLAMNRVVGVEDVQISLASGEATVRYDEQQTSPAKLNEVVIGTGFGVDGIAATNGHDPRPNYCG
jgi:copper chaperone CopZ